MSFMSGNIFQRTWTLKNIVRRSYVWFLENYSKDSDFLEIFFEDMKAFRSFLKESGKIKGCGFLEIFLKDSEFLEFS